MDVASAIAQNFGLVLFLVLSTVLGAYLLHAMLHPERY